MTFSLDTNAVIAVLRDPGSIVAQRLRRQSPGDVAVCVGAIEPASRMTPPCRRQGFKGVIEMPRVLAGVTKEP